MRKKYLCAIVGLGMMLGLGGCKSRDVAINSTTFPDEKFRDYVKEYCDEDSNGKLSSEEIGATQRLHLVALGVSDLKGIEVFTNLKILNCSENQLTELDLSQNPKVNMISAGGNQLTKVDVSGLEELSYLKCPDNQLSELDVSKNACLVDLDVAGNQLKHLDLSQNPELEFLECGKNPLEGMDVSNNLFLFQFGCEQTQQTALDLTHNPMLYILNCTENSLSELDVSKCSWDITVNADSSVKINREDKDANKGPAIDENFFPDPVFRNYILKEIDHDENGILSEREATSTRGLRVWSESDESKIHDLTGVNYFPYIVSLDCSDNDLTKLDLSGNIYLKELYCDGNRLTELDLSNTPKLEKVSCNGNQLTQLDVSKCERLYSLDCRNNQLSELDCSGERKLVFLKCEGNPLKKLDIRNCRRNIILSVDKNSGVNIKYPAGYNTR